MAQEAPVVPSPAHRTDLRERIRRRLADETGRLVKEAPFTVALTYPSPYGAAMSSLGFQRIYRAIMEAPGLACERAFLDDEAENGDAAQQRPGTYESQRPLEDFPIIAVSVMDAPPVVARASTCAIASSSSARRRWVLTASR